MENAEKDAQESDEEEKAEAEAATASQEIWCWNCMISSVLTDTFLSS